MAVVAGSLIGLSLTATPASAAPTSTTFAAWVALNNSIASLTQSADASISPTLVTQGSNYTLTEAGSTQVIPTSNGGVPVIYATNNNNEYALPPGVTFVSAVNGSYTFTPSNGSPTTGTESVTYCDPSTTMPAACTGTVQKSVLPVELRGLALRRGGHGLDPVHRGWHADHDIVVGHVRDIRHHADRAPQPELE